MFYTIPRYKTVRILQEVFDYIKNEEDEIFKKGKDVKVESKGYNNPIIGTMEKINSTTIHVVSDEGKIYVILLDKITNINYV